MNTNVLIDTNSILDDFIQAEDFTFKPFCLNNRIGDSGKLFIATAKDHSGIQYIVKNETPELASNEFMYHKIAALLDLCTPAVKLFRATSKRALSGKHSAGIRFIQNAKEYDPTDSSIENLHDFYSFQVLYLILYEFDSQEFYINESGRIIKIDNAASFHLDFVDASLIIDFDKSYTNSEQEVIDRHLRRRAASSSNYRWFGEVHKRLVQDHGVDAENASKEIFLKFAGLDTEALEDAYQALSMIYPERMCSFYRSFVNTRKNMCARFLFELDS